MIDLKRLKFCPRCAERVKAAAQVCRYCSYEFPKEIVAAPPDRTLLKFFLIAGALGATLGASFAFQMGFSKNAVPPPPAARQAFKQEQSPVQQNPAIPSIAVGSTLNWTAESAPDEIIRMAGPYTLTITKAAEGEFVAPVINLTSAGQSINLRGTTTSPGFQHRISLFQNIRGSAPILMLQGFSGGAHCCTETKLVGFSSGKLKVVDLGSWDGEPQDPPTDVNGDGVADFQFVDNTFLYAFASYASSYAPAKILNVRGGKVIDVSRQSGFRKLHLASMKKAAEACTSGSSGDERNGACPAYVASAALVGQLEQAWRDMTSSYDAATGWDFPAGCRVASENGCPSGQEIPAKSYPEALLLFLKERGYIAKGWQPPEFFQPDAVVPDEDKGSEQTI